MRARNIKPGLFKNEILGSSDPLFTLLFEGLWCLADREGRLEDRPLRIKAEVFPYRDNLDIHRYLTELERTGFVQRYKVGELALIQVLNFKKHQNPHHTEKKSELPAPVNSPLVNGEYPADSLIPDSLIQRTLSSEASDGTSPTASKKTVDPSHVAAVEGVFAYQLSKFGRNPKTYEYTDSRRSKGLLRLRECLRKTGGDLEAAIALMKLAIDNCAADDWAMNRDPKARGKDFHLWERHHFGSYEAMESWWNRTGGGA
jgi:hypothetical protein